MKNIPSVDFGNLLYHEFEGMGAFVQSFSHVDAPDFEAYCQKLAAADFPFMEQHRLGDNSFVTYAREGSAVYLSYYPNVKEMRIVTEEKSAYLTFSDEKGEKCTTSQLTQIDLEDFGLSYVLRLDDGRFIVFDGGWQFEPDADSLMRTLETQSEGRPQIAAWIMTHPHLDHYRCFLIFHEKYRDRVDIERFIYNFPDVNDTDRMPCLMDYAEIEHIQRFEKYVAETGAKIYKAHTGQVYEIGNARMEILSSPDDTFFAPVKDFNPFSLIIKMQIEGQTILWGTDAHFNVAKLGERYGDYLKSDILQVPHHGFGGGRILEYGLIDPSVCLCACFEREAYETMNIYMEHNRFLLFDLNVDEFYTGGTGDITLQLPCRPRPNGRKLYMDRIFEVQKGLGAKSWYFMDLTPETAVFTILNPTAYPIHIYVDLFFDEASDYVDSIKLVVPGRTAKRCNITDTSAVDPDALFFNRRSLAKIGVAPGKPFTAHFRAKYPVVIKGPKAPEYFR